MALSYKISKNIPPPETKEYITKYDKLPLEKLKVGESILLKDVSHKVGESYSYTNAFTTLRVAVIMTAYRKELSGRFKVGIHKKSETKKEIRVWKIK